MTLSDSIAVVGYAARLPGASSADEAWQILQTGRCTVSQIPSDRFSVNRFYDPTPNTPGKSYTFRAGVIENPFDFDAAAFGISPLEARQMDPQQRILLETVHQAFTHAGINPHCISGGATGVYIGASGADHSVHALQAPKNIEAHFMLGNTLSILANRISFQWNLRGPSFTVDTACSSGLVAFDKAVADLNQGKIDTAVVGSINLLLSPMPFIGFSQARMLSPDGVCRPFSEAANGYVRAEGSVAFILRRADVAAKAGERIRSLVISSATNSDGRKSGITHPSASIQEQLLRQSLEQSQVDPNDVVLFEAHGTGTPVGDPVEALAIGQSYGACRKTPLTVGSAKGNFGHLEPASGLVGLLKAQMALEFRSVPATLHAETLNPAIKFEELNINVQRVNAPINPDQDRIVAAVNSFGFGGANAHVLIQRDRSMELPEHAPAKTYPALRISAASDGALRDLAATWKDRLTSDEPLSAAAIENANWRTTLYRKRLCVPSGPSDELADALTDWLEGSASVTAVAGHAVTDQAKVAFVFAGNGAVWDGMARDIYAVDPVFRQSLQRTGRLFRKAGGTDICKTLLSDDLADRLGQAQTDQSLLFAIQIGLVAALKARGLRPHAVTGHSVGEVAAAVTSGAISIKTGVDIILARSRRLESLRGTGTMAAFAASPADVEELINQQGSEIEIAALNTDSSVTVAGSVPQIDQMLKTARKNHIAGRRLKIDYPYHSSALDRLEIELRGDLEVISARAPRLPFFAGCTGDLYDQPLDGDFWWMNARKRVQFGGAIAAMCATGVGVMIEISPRAVLQSYLRDIIKDQGAHAVALRGLDQSPGHARTADTIALEALSHAASMDASILLGQNSPLVTQLPSYPFERSEYRLSYEDGHNVLGGSQSTHTLLGEKLIADGTEWRNDLSVGNLPWTKDHKVYNRIVLPATAIIEMFRAAAEQICAPSAFALTDLTFQRPAILSESVPLGIRVTYDASVAKLTLQGRAKDNWQTLSSTRVFQFSKPDQQRLLLDWGDNPRRLYQNLAESGLDYGPEFRRIHSVARNGTSIDIRLKGDPTTSTDFGLDPVAADASLHAVALVLDQSEEARRDTFLPTRIERFEHFTADPIAGARLEIVHGSREQVVLNVTFVTSGGTVAAKMHGLCLTPVRDESRIEALVWEEALIPVVTSKEIVLVPDSVDVLLRKRPPPTDREALRAAIGGRLAWDKIHDKQTSAAIKTLAADVLASAKLSESDVQTAPSPWPEQEVLIDLFAKAIPTATDELQSILEAVCDTQPRTIETAGLADAVENVFPHLALSKLRVALVGKVDAGLATYVARHSAYALLATQTRDDATAMSYQVAPNVPLSIRVLEDAAKDHPFDVVIGIDLARSCATGNFSKIKALIRPGGHFYSFEERIDAFSLMTGRHASSAVTAEAIRHFRLTGLTLGQRYLADFPSVEVWTATRDGDVPERRPAWKIVGDGAIAEALMRASDADGPEMTAIILAPHDSIYAATRHFWQVFVTAEKSETPVWIIQEGAVGSASLRGWRRSITNELGRDFRTASIEDGTDPDIVAKVLASTQEHELTFSGQTAHAPRLRPQAAPSGGPSVAHILTKSRNPNESTLSWRVAPRRAPDDTEIEVAVAATGLNFRDLMWAQDLLPYDAMHGGFAGATLGMECAGVVQRAGHNSGFDVGQGVLLVSPASFATYVTIDARCATGLPADVDLIAAAGLPVAAMTALYALQEVAALQKSETLLIHAAAGGVGLAAVQIAQSVGAEIIATAGTSKKRAFLKSLGIRHVFDSRTLAFAQQVHEVTAGRGVDVVLNSLAGPAMEASVGCVAPFGRFVELGKRDYFANTALPLRPFRKNISYFGVDIDQLFRQKPKIVARLFHQISEQFQKSKLDPLPTQVFSSDGVEDAFNRMQSARHIGKIVVKPPQPPVISKVIAPKPIRGTWLVVGGTSGFGLATAKWLVEQGADTLWLVSQSGLVPESEVAELKDIQAQIQIRRCDVSDPEKVELVINEITDLNGSLSGVVHAAMVLRDKAFGDLRDEDISTVLDPKILGAENLDRFTRDHDLDYFLLYGSISARLGTIGQAPYVAANLALEDISARRHKEGLPSLTVAWGPIGDVGYLARQTGLRDLLEAELGPCMTAKSGLARLAALLRSGVDAPALTIAPNVVTASPLRTLSGPLYADVRRIAKTDAASEAIDFGKIIAEQGPEAARKILLDRMRKEAARIMRISPSAVDTARPLNEMGFDSLMGVNFMVSLEKHLMQTIAIPEVSMDVTLQELAKKTMDAAGSKEPKVLGKMADRHIASTKMSQLEIDEIKGTSPDVDQSL